MNIYEMTVAELKAEAKNLNLVGYSKLKKAELISLIENAASNEMISSVTDNSIYSHETTPADGQGLIGLVYGAFLSCSLRIITDNELDKFETLYNSVASIDDLLANRELMKIVNRIPKAFQVRHKHTGTKGMFLVFPLELVEQTKDIDIVITDGLSKYGNQSWGTTDIEVCAYLKKKAEWVSLNVQFINALINYTEPTFLLPIVDYWHSQAVETLTNDIAKLKFHNIVSSFGGEDDNDLRLATALKTNISLKNERYMVNLASEQYNKFYTGLMTGRMMVPGIYSYMLTDPIYMLNQLFNTRLEGELKSGEYWCNGKTCLAGLFRSPMIAPFEAQKVQLVSHKFFDVFYRDVTIFNGHDGAWELMSGADFDGDTCACIPNDTDMGNIIVSAIKEQDYVILHESKSAQKVQYNADTFWADLAKYNSTVARADRTGLITNHATKAVEMWHHLKNVLYYAKKNDCVGIYMYHPNQCRKDENGNIINTNPHTVMINGEKWFGMRGLVYANKDTGFKWVEEYPCGKHSFEDIEELMYKYMLKVEYLNPIQGDEIDGAKTGYYPELFKAIEIPFQSEQTTARNIAVGKTVSKTAKKNSYVSYSPLGIIYKYAEQKYNEFKELLESKTADKMGLLMNLLTAEESAQLNTNLQVGNDVMSLIDYIKLRRTEFGKQMYAVANDHALTEEEKIQKYSALKNGIDLIENGEVVHHKGEIETLVDLAGMLNVSEEVIAVACYIATNERNGQQNSGLGYGWMLFDQLLSVFARDNEQVVLYRVPGNTETVAVANGELFINGKKFTSVEAVDCDYVPVQNINGRLFALVRKNKIAKTTGNAVSGIIVNTGVLMGFKYNGESVDSFKQTIVANGYQFVVNYDDESNICAFVNGKLFCRLSSTGADSRNIGSLVGHTVKVVKSPNYEEYAGGIKNLMVQVIA